MEVIIYKLKKMFSIEKILKFIGNALMVLIVFGFFSMIGTVIFEIIVILGILAIQSFGIPLNPSSHTIDIVSVLLSMTTVGVILYRVDKAENEVMHLE
jgi:hypothetical protein